jgi:hypothetical protein
MSVAAFARAPEKGEAAPAWRGAGGLRIGPANDAFEREADRVPKAVMADRSVGWSLSRMNVHAPVRRKCAQCEEEENKLQRKPTGIAGAFGAAPPIVHEVLRSPGEPLDAGTRSFFEARFGRDLSQVRVHADVKAAASARAVNALAYTVGRDVVFGAGRYRPGALEGKRLLAHELSHVVQQQSTRPTALASLKLIDDSRAEREAEHMADRVAQAAKVDARNFNLQKLGLQRQAAPKDLGLKVVGHGASAEAVGLASDRLFEILGGLGAPEETALKDATVELHIIPHDKKLTDLPEFASLKGSKTFDGRNYDDLRGVGGTKVGNIIRYAVAEEQLVSVSGKPSGYAKGFVASHESGHVIEQFGLTPDQQKALQQAFDARTKAGGPWLNPKNYTSSRVGEYFAQCVSAYFNRPYSDSAEDKRMYTRDWLMKNDPEMYKLLNSVYSSPRQPGDFPERTTPTETEYA